MTKNQNNDPVGDTQSPALEPNAKGLRGTGDLATHLAANAAPKSSMIVPIADLAKAQKGSRSNSVESPTCNQTLWFSFFFDGTGNNMVADVGTLKHSNVAKLFRVHAENDKNRGIYRVYVPGEGTYFVPYGARRRAMFLNPTVSHKAEPLSKPTSVSKTLRLGNCKKRMRRRHAVVTSSVPSAVN